MYHWSGLTVTKRVLQQWLHNIKETVEPMKHKCVAVISTERLVAIHNQSGHSRIRWTLYFVQQINPAVSKAAVWSVMKQCKKCKSIDPPPPVCWIKECFGVKNDWERVGIDITHYTGNNFLTLINCGPSWHTIWQPLHWQDSASVVHQLKSIFWKQGPPVELLMDNDKAFTSNDFYQFVKRWSINLHYRCIYAPARNGIEEQSHQSIKTIAARKQCSMLDTLYWYNLMPKDGISCIALAEAIHNYPVQIRCIDTVPLPNIFQSPNTR